MITKGLIIDTPHIDRILSGDKVWEMRSTSTKQRGPIALIRKGSGLIVGTVEIVDSIGPLTREVMLANVRRHRVDPSRIESGAIDKWNYAWVLSGARALAQPVRYSHPPGAVIWVTLGPELSQRLTRE